MASKLLNLLINLTVRDIFRTPWSRFLLIVLIPYQLVEFLQLPNLYEISFWNSVTSISEDIRFNILYNAMMTNFIIFILKVLIIQDVW